MKPNLTFLLLFFLAPILAAEELPEQLKINIPRPDVANKEVTFELTRYSVRDTDFMKIYLDENSYSSRASKKGANPDTFKEYSAKEFPIRTYRGHVLEQPNSTVVAVIWPGNTMSAIVNEGKRILWKVDDLPIRITSNNNAVATKSVNTKKKSTLNKRKSWDWNPTFGNKPIALDDFDFSQTVNRTKVHGWPLTPDMQKGISRVQLVVDAEPEWFDKKANNSMEKALSIIEHSVNLLDLVYVRDLSISYVLTAYLQRTDTNLHVKAGDTVKTWTENGLGLNLGSSKSNLFSGIPFQQMIWAYVDEGNPFAYRSRLPLQGGNFSRVVLKREDASGLSHEVGHNWGGSHFVYPRDSMSGGGPWFGPTTAQRMIYLRNSNEISGGLGKITNKQYNWNVHPYATPDMVRTDIDKGLSINVLGNDYDGNGDAITVAQFSKESVKGGQINQCGNQLCYQPKKGFQGRDSFMYMTTDGKFTNGAWVQIDVGGDLLVQYNFESTESEQYDRAIRDSSGSDSHGRLVNFAGKEALVKGVSGKGLKFPWLMHTNDANLPDRKSSDDVRPLIDIGDVFDPLDGDQSVSMWIKFDEKSLNSEMPVYLLSNSSSVIHTLVSGYNVYTDKSANAFHFELREQISVGSESELPPLRRITHKPSGGLLANKWYNLVLVIDRKVNRISAYVNGNKVVTDNEAMAKLTPGSFIKGKPSGGRYISAGLGINTYKPKKYGPFAGVMDEFSVYARALSESEIKQHWRTIETQSTTTK